MRCKVCWLFQERQNREGGQLTENHHGRVSLYKCPALGERKNGWESVWGPAAGGKSRPPGAEPPGKKAKDLCLRSKRMTRFHLGGGGGGSAIAQVTTGIWDWSLHVAFRVLAPHVSSCRGPETA